MTRLLKLAVISFFILFAVVTAIGLLFPATVRVSRAINISASYDTVYHYLNNTRYWKVWMQGADSATIKIISEQTEGTGTEIKIGTGKVSFIRNTTDSILTVWTSEKGSIQTSAFVLLKNPAATVTTVQWYFEQQLKWYPWERFGSMGNDKILGPVMEESLDKLKKILE
ncbi:MAG TPA: hypothetical protein PLA68_02050 [Panacibacter sp.]|nr:hypothetical protein [Panacibacter sp.]